MIDKNRLTGLLFAIMGSNTLVERWWATPNKSLDMKSPNLMYEINPERVRDLILSYTA